MPTIAPRGEARTLASQDRSRPDLGDGSRRVVVTAEGTRRLPTARECGLGVGTDATGGARCRDIMPELLIELI